MQQITMKQLINSSQSTHKNQSGVWKEGGKEGRINQFKHHRHPHTKKKQNKHSVSSNKERGGRHYHNGQSRHALARTSSSHQRIGAQNTGI